MKKNSVSEFLQVIDRNDDSEQFISEIRHQKELLLKDSTFQKSLLHFQALSNETRLLIYEILKTQELCTCALSDILGLSQGTITHHLKKLDEAGLIMGRKQGYFTVYYTTERMLSSVR